MAIDIELWGAERHTELTAPLRTAFGLAFDPERAANMQRLPDFAHRIAALDGGSLVGSSAAFDFTMTTPGGAVRSAGLTMVAVLPTHRRQGVLRGMMRRHFEVAAAAGLPTSSLWASEGSIYGRFGYGVASLRASISIERDRASFSRALPREGKFRLLDRDAARAAFPAVYDRVREATPGMMRRSEAWWDLRRLSLIEKGGAPMQHLLLEIDGRAEGYALYRPTDKLRWHPVIENTIGVAEAVATSPRATALLWRYLFDIDLAKSIEAELLHPGHPVFHLVAEARRLNMNVGDALWVRLIDVEASLARRAWSSGDAVTLEVRDDFCPWNTGVYRVDGAGRSAGRAGGAAELRMGVSALGSLYLGGVTAHELWAAGEIEEIVPGAVLRADSLFRSPQPPWCPEVF